MKDEKKCDHKWRSVGVWDGENPDGQAIGGKLYKCDLCNDEARTVDEINTKGGSIIEGTDIYGRPLV